MVNYKQETAVVNECQGNMKAWLHKDLYKKTAELTERTQREKDLNE